MIERRPFIRIITDFDPLPHTPLFGGAAIGVGIAAGDVGVIAVGGAVFLSAKLLQNIERVREQKKQNRKD